MTRLQELLDRGIAAHGVPGAALAVFADGTLQVAVSGITNARTGLPVQEDTLFQIGSISKVWTSTLAVQLVEEGILDLDLPIAQIDPSLAVGGEAGAGITVRHLLSHTSGMECDLIVDTGRGDDVLEKYVAAVADHPLMHEPGELWSYCNAGFSVAGRVMEILTGRTWDQLIQERIAAPLSLTHTATLAEEVLLHSAALGHIHGAGQEFVPADEWFFPRSIGPSGSVVTRVCELIAFGRMHLAASESLSDRSIQAMREQVISAPELVPGLTGWCMGWGHFDWNGQEVFAHTGGTIGQYAYFTVHPASGAVFALLTNGGGADGLVAELQAALGDELLGAAPPALRTATGAVPTDVPYGHYTRFNSSATLRVGPDGPEIEIVDGPLDTGEEEHRTVLPLGVDASGTLVVSRPGAAGATAIFPLTLRNGARALMVSTRLLVERSA